MDGNYQQIKRSSEQTEMHRHTSMGTGVPTWMNARAHSPSHPPTDPDIHRCTHSCTSRWVWGRFRNRWASHSHVSQNSRHSRWMSLLEGVALAGIAAQKAQIRVFLGCRQEKLCCHQLEASAWPVLGRFRPRLVREFKCYALPVTECKP